VINAAFSHRSPFCRKESPPFPYIADIVDPRANLAGSGRASISLLIRTCENRYPFDVEGPSLQIQLPLLMLELSRFPSSLGMHHLSVCGDYCDPVTKESP
jgi:hypothetical protein